MEKMSSLIEKIEMLPASPALLPKLARTLERLDKADVTELVDIIAFDSALTAKLLQIANSAYFGISSAITDVGEAISQIGYDAVFLLAAAITGEQCMKVAPGTGLDEVLLWKHSVTVAFGAQHLARGPGLDGNLAFTAGLLHDLGKIVFSETYGKNYTNMLGPARHGTLSLPAWESEHYGCDHAEAGAALLENWRLPGSLVAAVKCHHHPSAAGEYARLAACVSVGNALSRSLEKAKFDLEPETPDVPVSLTILGLAPEELEGHWNRIRENWQFVQTLHGLKSR